MKTIKQLMTFVVVCICAIAQVDAKERVAPIKPIASVSDITDGMEVYLINMGNQQAVHYNSEASSDRLWPRHFLTHATKITIHIPEEGRYRFQVTEDRFFYSYGDQTYARTPGDKRDYYLMRDSLDAFMIQEAPESAAYDSENEFVGFNSDDYLHTNLTSGNIFWSIVPATEEGLKYISKFLLYNALVASDTYHFDVDKYEEIYTNEESTPEELTNAAQELNSALALSTYAQTSMCGGDYPILLQDDPNHAWERYENCLIRNWNMNAGETQTLTATIEVDEDATIYYEPYNNNERTWERGEYYHDYHRNSNYWTSHNYNWRNSYTERYVYMDVYVDDELVRTINRKALGRDGWRYFEELKPGKHTIKWVSTCPEGVNGQYIDIQYIRVYKTPLTEVTLVEPGSLGTEVLYQHNRIQDVRKLKVKGPMNSADWTQIDNMYELFALDLSEATITEIPASQLSRNAKSDTKSYLHSVKLPNSLETIGNNAFYESYLDDMDFPASLKYIGDRAFDGTYLTKAVLPQQMDHIGEGAFNWCLFLKEVQMPETIGSLGTWIFSNCCFMEKATLPTNITIVPAEMFQHCLSLENVHLHEGITTFGDRAFARCLSFNPKIPSTAMSFGVASFDHTAIDTLVLNPNAYIGDIAFHDCSNLRHLTIPEGVTLGCLAFGGSYGLESLIVKENVSLNEGCFGWGSNLRTVELPTSYYTVEQIQPVFFAKSGIKEVKLKSATMVKGSYVERFFYNMGTDITIRVPDFLVTTYKQDAYWKNYNIEGFDNSEVDYWQISQPLTLTYRDRLQGSPNVEVTRYGRFVINGDAAMSINDFSTCQDLNWPGNNGWNTMVISNCDNVMINGQVSHYIYTTDNIWYAVCLPFDFKVSDIRTDNNAKFAIRYYDGDHRAKNGNGGNWVDFPADTIVTAGTGFIYRTSKSANSWFYAIDNGSKQTVVSNNEFAKQLNKNDSEDPAHKGWNLVGNPYQCYYNIHKLNTTAPITVFEHEWTEQRYNSSWQWRPTVGSYKAYSLIDDDYALLPNAAFFIQCPDEATVITFPTTGRQLTAEITDQNGVKAFVSQPQQRKLIDLRLSTGGMEEREEAGAIYDQTRVVFNAAASLGYERTCDAGKFSAEDKTLPQFFSLDDHETRYAINERPTDDGTVRLGVIIPRAGTYYIYVSRNSGAGTILLHDKQQGTVTDITDREYSFYAETGTFNDRFELVAKTLANGIEDHLQMSDTHQPLAIPTDGGIQLRVAANVYSLDGRLVARSQGGYLPIKQGIYVVRAGKQTDKVTVK